MKPFEQELTPFGEKVTTALRAWGVPHSTIEDVSLLFLVCPNCREPITLFELECAQWKKFGKGPCAYIEFVHGQCYGEQEN